MSYSVYSKFDINQHKKTFINYLEVMISPDGEVSYAVPSHQQFAENIACKLLNRTRDSIIEQCPIYVDYLDFLLNLTGYVAVWNDFIAIGSQRKLTKNQRFTLRQLKQEGLYKGNFKNLS